MSTKKTFHLHTCLLGILLLMLATETASAASIAFGGLTVSSGAAISQPYQANAGTRLNPDTLTLHVDSTASEIVFALTVSGSGFAGPYCELDWDDDAIGAPASEKRVAVVNGAFSSVETFRLAAARLNLGSSGSRSVLYELDADNEPDGPDSGDAERYLLVTYIGGGSGVQPATATISFGGLAIASGATISQPYQVNAGTRLEPDTLTLRADSTASEIAFALTVSGSGFAGPYCELDWDDDAIGAPTAEKRVAVVNGAFSSVETFRLASVRLNLGTSGSRSILYELDADNEPDGLDSGDAERFLLITYVADGSSPSPGGPTDTGSSGGGGCSGAPLTASALVMPILALFARRSGR